MTEDKQQALEPHQFISIYLKLGLLLFQNGATVQRVIDTIGKVKQYLGGDDIHVIIEYDGLVLTDVNGQRYETRVERRRFFAGLNVEVLIAISKLVHHLDFERPTITRLKQHIDEIATFQSPLPGWLQHIVVGVAAVSFGVVNGADFLAVAAIFPAAVLLSAVKKSLLQNGFNLFMSVLIAGVVSVMVSGCLAINLGTTAGLVALIAVLLPQVPGFPLINAGIDVLHNHNTVAWGRIAFAAMMITALALAVCLPLLLFYNELQVEPHSFINHWQVQLCDIAFAGVAAMGLGLLFNAPARYVPLLGCGACVARSVRTELMVLGGLDISSAALWGAICASLIASIVSRRSYFPTAVFALICVLPMIPGYLAIDGLNNLFIFSRLPFDAITPEFGLRTLQMLLKVVFTLSALVLGIIFPVFLFEGRSLRI